MSVCNDMFWPHEDIFHLVGIFRHVETFFGLCGHFQPVAHFWHVKTFFQPVRNFSAHWTLEILAIVRHFRRVGTFSACGDVFLARGDIYRPAWTYLGLWGHSSALARFAAGRDIFHPARNMSAYEDIFQLERHFWPVGTFFFNQRLEKFFGVWGHF